MDLMPIKPGALNAKEEEARKSGNEILKRYIKKKSNPAKIVWSMIKKAMIPILIKFLTIMAVALAVFSIIAGFVNLITKKTDTNASNSNYIINTSVAGAAPTIDEEQLKQLIEEGYTGETQTNLQEIQEDLMYIQETYNINAVFAIAVAERETKCGTDWTTIPEDTNNIVGLKTADGEIGKYDSFGEAIRDFGKIISEEYSNQEEGYDINSIAQQYSDNSEEWAVEVKAIITKIYNTLGITYETPGGYNAGTTTDGLSIFVDGQGRQYIEYTQRNPDYKNITYCHTSQNNSLLSVGCAVTSVAIVSSGFGSNADPVYVRNYCAEHYNGCYHALTLNHLTGMNWTKIRPATWDKIIEQLERGYPTIIGFKGKGKILTTSAEHRIAILSISEDGMQVYISDPANRADGWQFIEELQDVKLLEYYKVVE